MYNTYKPELMSPAGNAESARAAVENGCTAIYAGLTEFNARNNAGNFTLKELEHTIDYCHLRGVKLYVTANTLIKSNEINRFLGLVESIYLIGADGVIVQDIGCALLIKKYFPDFYLLASTQMTIHNSNGANFLRKHGFDRVVLSRELSVSEIAAINNSIDIQTECFIHGALCVCYSGLCLFSAFNGGRSGNRGVCAQPCRLRYSLLNGTDHIAGGSLLSPKDAIGLYALPELIKSGVSSFKIEGRMKSAEYVAGVTSVYRKYIDLYTENPSAYRVDESDVEKLAAVFNRSGFNKGYYADYSGKHMLTGNKAGNTGVYVGKAAEVKNRKVFFEALSDISSGDGIVIQNSGAYITKSCKKGDIAEVILKEHCVKGDAVYRTYNKRLMDELRMSYETTNRKIEISGRLYAKKGERVCLKVRYNDVEYESYAEIPQSAKTSAAAYSSVEHRIKKTGGTPFRFRDLKIELDDGLFLSVSELNKIRREALSGLEEAITDKYKRKAPKDKPRSEASTYKISGERELTVLVRNAEQLKALTGFNFSRLYADFDADCHELNAFKKKGVRVFKCLPHIEREVFNSNGYEDHGAYDGLLVRAYGQAEQLSDKFELAADYTLNTYNDKSVEFWSGEKFKSVCLSPELSVSEMGKIPGNTEAVIYGKIPLMLTVQCPIGNFCDDKSKKPFCRFKNRDEVFKMTNGKSYDLMPICKKCYCIILSATPLHIATGLQCRYNRIEFTNENFVDAKNIMSIFAR